MGSGVAWVLSESLVRASELLLYGPAVLGPTNLETFDEVGCDRAVEEIFRVAGIDADCSVEEVAPVAWSALREVYPAQVVERRGVFWLQLKRSLRGSQRFVPVNAEADERERHPPACVVGVKLDSALRCLLRLGRETEMSGCLGECRPRTRFVGLNRNLLACRLERLGTLPKPT
jgi:hypothetical protein